MRKQHFSHVKRPKNTRLGKCNVCIQLAEERFKRKDKEEIIRLSKEHLNLQAAQRKLYYKRRDKAKMNPEKYMSIIIDKMTPVYLPVKFPISKSMQNLIKIGAHNVGIINHGRQREFNWIFECWSQGADMSISTLFLYLKRFVC